ncbi:MAG: FAD-dependent 5-carboxymethylaminomethyl-2-thiouridine(34) oxidoreductase MnmC [Moraxellaceae bacterium]|nr:FAD-dependent 5-carboxymethylaminomethyl-2-thiouridine(34) oxidoreductase MnmC [Moraxellaceae bacterium]
MSCPKPDVLVIGAGIAGASAAWTLAERGLNVTVLEANKPGHGGSGNPAALLYPKLVKAADLSSNLHSFAYLHTLSVLQDPRLATHFQQTGVLWLRPHDEDQHIIDDQHPWNQHYVWPLSAEQASIQAGINITHNAYWLPQAGVINPQGMLSALLSHPLINLVSETEVLSVHDDGQQWHAACEHHRFTAPYLVIANAGEAQRLKPTASLPIKPVRGQISSFTYESGPKVAIAYGGYLAPTAANEFCLGATFQRGRTDCSPSTEDQLSNRDALAQWLPQLMDKLPNVSLWRARASLRWQTPDYLPLVGALPDMQVLKDKLTTESWARNPQWPTNMPQRLQVSLGHGSKGFSQAWVAAELIANNLTGTAPGKFEPFYLALRPDRFLLRQWRRGQLNEVGSE